MTHWLIRVGNGDNFIRSSKYQIWGMNANDTHVIRFLKGVLPGDYLWFITKGSSGKVIAVATYASQNLRENPIVEPLIRTTLTDEELGWDNISGKKCGVEIHYTDLYNVRDCDLITGFTIRATTLRYPSEHCKLDLEQEYANICKYCKIARDFTTNKDSE
jgi:hypothetical protein